MSAAQLLVIATWLDSAALCALVGAAVSRLWVFAGKPTPEAAIMRRGDRLAGVAFGLLLVSSSGVLWARAASMGGVGLDHATGLMGLVLTQTHYGTFWWVRLAGVLVAGIASVGPRRFAPWLWWAGAIAIAFSRAATGHASDAGDFSVREWVDTVHLLAGCAWIGVIIAFLVAYPRLQPSPAFVPALGRLSSAAWLSFDVVLFTGLYGATTAFAGEWRHAWGSPYAEVLGVKLALVGVMLAFGAFNRSVVARLAAGSGVPGLTQRLRNSLRGELTVAAGVLVAAAFLVQTMPPGHGVQ